MNSALIQQAPNPGLPSGCHHDQSVPMPALVYLLRTVAVADSFLVFIIDLGYRDYSPSRVSARSGKDQLAKAMFLTYFFTIGSTKLFFG